MCGAAWGLFRAVACTILTLRENFAVLSYVFICFLYWFQCGQKYSMYRLQACGNYLAMNGGCLCHMSLSWLYEMCCFLLICPERHQNLLSLV